MRSRLSWLPIAAVIIMILAATLSGHARRRVTPAGVTEPGTSYRAATDSVDLSRYVEQTDASGRIVLVDTVAGVEYVDSTSLIPVKKMIYPLIHSVSAGVNIWDAGMRALGQKYGIGSVWAWLSLHNRYMPSVEIGLSSASDTPDDANFTFKSPLAPYFKIGMNYNFLYNSTPDYQLYAGVRYGFTPFRYSVDNVTVDEGYWDDPSHFSIPSRSATAGWFEILLGIKVKIAGNVSMGWTVGYHSILHESAAPYGKPMIIPGFGKRGNSLTAGLSVIYTLPINKTPLPAVNNSDDN